MKDIRNSIQILTEKCSYEEKESIIRKATKIGMITFATASFGFGSDFVCRDQIIWEIAGGVHVLLTFLPEDKSTLAQFKGRTAR